MEVCNPNNFSGSWKRTFARFGTDHKIIKSLREDFQLFFLQKQNKRLANCLHLICKKACNVILQGVIEMADTLSLTYKLKVKDDFYKVWEASGKHTAPKN